MGIISCLRGGLHSLGAFLVLYATDLADVTEKHGVRLHSFADDIQLYLHCRRDDMASTAVRLERCLMEIGHWMSSNRLRLNADKTELLWAGSRGRCPSLGDCGPTLWLGVDSVVPSNDVRVLGVTLSSGLSDIVVRSDDGQAHL